MRELHQGFESPEANIAHMTPDWDSRSPHKRIDEIVDWVVANVPWTIAVPDWPEFHDRWPLLSRAELIAVEQELGRRGALRENPDADLDAVAASLLGRETRSSAAADWLLLHPGGDITHPEFFRLFGHLSRAELVLAVIERKRRIGQEFEIFI